MVSFEPIIAHITVRRYLLRYRKIFLSIIYYTNFQGIWGGGVKNFLRTSFKFFFEGAPVQNRTPPPFLHPPLPSRQI